MGESVTAIAGVLPSSIKPCKASYQATWPEMSSRRRLGEISSRWGLWPIHLDMEGAARRHPNTPLWENIMARHGYGKSRGYQTHSSLGENEMRSKEWEIFQMGRVSLRGYSITRILTARLVCALNPFNFVEFWVAFPLVLTCRQTNLVMWCL